MSITVRDSAHAGGSDPRGERSAAVTAARQLTVRKHRERRREFLAEGPQAIAEAIAAGCVTALYGTSEALDAQSELVAMARSAGAHVTAVTPAGMASLSETVTPQGLVAVCQFIDVELGAVLAARPRLLAICASIQDPGNAGTILRTADAAGVDAVIFTSASVDPYNGKCVRAAVGSTFHPKIVRGGDPAEVVRAVRAAGLRTLSTTARGELSLGGPDLGKVLVDPTAWLFGNEARGLPPELIALTDTTVAIPIYGHAESLNLATAAALCLYASATAQRG